MESQARPHDLLLAYDPDFVGYTSLREMSQPLEQAGSLAVPLATGALGGTADPDGYYDDFTARLDRFVRAHPRLGVLGGGRVPDWRALVVTLGEDYGYDGGDHYDDYAYGDEYGFDDDRHDDDRDGGGGDDGRGGDDDGSGGGRHNGGSDDRGDSHRGSGGGGGGASSGPALVTLGEFIVAVDGGLASGEMDEADTSDLAPGEMGGSDTGSFASGEMDEGDAGSFASGEMGGSDTGGLPHAEAPGGPSAAKDSIFGYLVSK